MARIIHTVIYAVGLYTIANKVIKEADRYIENHRK